MTTTKMMMSLSNDLLSMVDCKLAGVIVDENEMSFVNLEFMRLSRKEGFVGSR